MYEHLLVPLDGSDLAEAVVPYVEELAQKLSSDVTLLRAVESLTEILTQTTSMSSAGVSPTLAEMSMDIAKQRYEATLEAGRTYLASVQERLQKAGIATKTHFAEEPAGDAILDYAKANDISLIAMSTHGRGGLGRLVFGSVADHLLRNSQVPVLLIRPQHQ